MTRFDYSKYDDGTESIYDTVKDKYYFNTTDFEDICKLLNKIIKENKLLKQRSEKAHFAKQYQKLYHIRSVSPNGVIQFTHGKKPSWRMKDVRQIKKELPPLEELTMRQLFEIKNRYHRFGQDVVGKIVYNIYQGTFDEYL